MEDFNSKYTGQQVEDLLDQVASGNAGGGGGGITVETDPIFSNSPAATITEEKIAGWDGKYTKPSGGIPKSDLSAEVQGALRDALAYKGTVTQVKINGSVKSPTDGEIDLGTVVTPEDIEDVVRLDDGYVVANGIESKDGLIYHLPGINPDDTAHTLATKDDVSSAIETYVADFTMEELRQGADNGVDVECHMLFLIQAMNENKVILVRESDDSSYQGVYVLNGYAEDMLYFSIVDTNGEIIFCDGTDYHTARLIQGSSLRRRSFDEKQDALVSGANIKTINGESILGSGNIPIAGGSGEKGEKGDKGDTGVGVQSVKQTTTSNVDSGYNVVTVTLTDGTTSTFSVKNGSKGSTGANGTNGVSVSSVKQTTISSADGGTNVVTVTLSNGTTSTFNVKNGSKGSNGTNGKDGADGATFTPSVDSAGNLSWTNNKGLTNPPTVNIKGPKGDAGEGGGSGGGGKEVVLIQGMHFNDTNPVQPNKIYISNRAQTALYIGAFQEASNYDEYCIIFKYPEDGVTLLESVKFVNGQIPTIEYATECELSVVGIGSGANRTYHAVLTPFKPV